MVSSPQRVLVCDVDAEARLACRRVVEYLGYELAEISTAEEALEASRETSPQLLILDWASLPEPQEDFISELLAVSGSRPEQVVVTCERERLDEVSARAKLMGLDVVLGKPLDPGLVQMAVIGAVALAEGDEGPAPEEVDDEGYAAAPGEDTSPDAQIPPEDTLEEVEPSPAAVEAEEAPPAKPASFVVPPPSAFAVPPPAQPRRKATPAPPSPPAAEEGQAAKDPWDEAAREDLEAEDLPDETEDRVEPVALQSEETMPVPTIQMWRAEALTVEARDAAAAADPGPTWDDEPTEAGVSPSEEETSAPAGPTKEALAWLEEGGEIPDPTAFDDVDEDRTSPWLQAKFVEVHRQELAGRVEAAEGTEEIGSEDLELIDEAPLGAEPPAAGVPEPVPPAGAPPPEPAPPAGAPLPVEGPAPEPAGGPPSGAAIEAPAAPAAVEAPAPPPAAPAAEPVAAAPPPKRAAPQVGQLAQQSFAELLASAIAHRPTGTLLVDGNERGRRLFLFVAGRPTRASSADPAEGLIPYLAARGLLDGAVANEALREATSNGEDQGDVVMRRGLVDPTTLPQAMHQHVAELCLDTMAWPEGTFTFEPGEAPADVPSGPLIFNAHLVVEGFLRHGTAPPLARLAEVHDSSLVVRVTNAPIDVAAIPLGRIEARVRDVALGGGRIEKIISQAGARPSVARAIVRALAVLGAVRVHRTVRSTSGAKGGAVRSRRRARRPEPAVQTPAAASPAPAVAASPVPAAPPVETVGGSPAPAAMEVEERPGPSMLPEGGLPSPEALAGPEEEATGEGEALWRAYRALGTGRPRTALGLLKPLVAEAPKTAAYHLYLGWATFRADPKNLKSAERVVLEGARLDPTSPDPYVLLHAMCTLVGDEEGARKHLSKAIDLGAEGGSIDLIDDNVDLEKEMRKAMKDAIRQERRRAATQKKGGLFDKLLKGK